MLKFWWKRTRRSPRSRFSRTDKPRPRKSKVIPNINKIRLLLKICILFFRIFTQQFQISKGYECIFLSLQMRKTRINKVRIQCNTTPSSLLKKNLETKKRKAIISQINIEKVLNNNLNERGRGWRG